MEQLIRHDLAAEIAIQIVLDGLTSPHSKRAYQRHLKHFAEWYRASGERAITKAIVQRYAAELHAQGVAAPTINQKLSAIRRLALEAADNGALDSQIANGIKAVKGVRSEGTRTGNWLTKQDAQRLLNAPDTATLKGLRDRAILAVLIGCGLRRAEAVRLKFEDIQQRDGRWVLVDLIGKRNKVRSVPMASWAKAAVDAYASAAGLSEGVLFRPVKRGGKIMHGRMSAQAIYNLVAQYSGVLDFGKIAPHDLRRSFARLAYRGGSALDQIQLSLGHGSIKTTESYLGVQQDLSDAPTDRLGLRLN
jgi:site-specific recombinase XerD